MSKLKILLINIMLTIFILIPIDIFIVYSIMKQLNLDRLVWFLFWVRIPLVILTTILTEILKMEDD